MFVFIFSNNSYLSIDIVPSDNSNMVVNNYNTARLSENIFIERIEKDNLWRIEIPKIGLYADISEGTNSDVLDFFVGHFDETSVFYGNVCLAAHNRGYNVNYFEKLKELETGDEIIYKYKGNMKKYFVKDKQIIKETDWSFLEETLDNRLTLITCVEDMPEYRRCVQAFEEKEE